MVNLQWEGKDSVKMWMIWLHKVFILENYILTVLPIYKNFIKVEEVTK